MMQSLTETDDINTKLNDAIDDWKKETADLNDLRDYKLA